MADHFRPNSVDDVFFYGNAEEQLDKAVRLLLKNDDAAGFEALCAQLLNDPAVDFGAQVYGQLST